MLEKFTDITCKSSKISLVAMHEMTPHNFDCKIVYNIDTKSVNYDAKKFYINDTSGLYYKLMMIVNDNSRVINKLEA